MKQNVTMIHKNFQLFGPSLLILSLVTDDMIFYYVYENYRFHSEDVIDNLKIRKFEKLYHSNSSKKKKKNRISTRKFRSLPEDLSRQHQKQHFYCLNDEIPNF